MSGRGLWAHPAAGSLAPVGCTVSFSSSSAAQRLSCEESGIFCGVAFSCNVGAPNPPWSAGERRLSLG